MKNVYINSRLHPLPVGIPALPRAAREWIFSLGDRWLLLTPPRLRRVAARIGLEDIRTARLLRAVRRWHPHPEDFCRALGVEEAVQPAPRNSIPVVCPSCDNVHYPHPADAFDPCPECVGAVAAADRRRPLPLRVAEEQVDRRLRSRLLREDPSAFDAGVLSPNWRINRRRRLDRDWDGAINRILLGRSYRSVAREFDCSPGLLHKKVSEAKHWEWN